MITLAPSTAQNLPERFGRPITLRQPAPVTPEPTKRSWAGSARDRTRSPRSRLPTSRDTWVGKALPVVAPASPCGTTRRCGRSSGLPNVGADGHTACPRPLQLRVCIGTRDCLWSPPQTRFDACSRLRKGTAPRICAIGRGGAALVLHLRAARRRSARPATGPKAAGLSQAADTPFFANRDGTPLVHCHTQPSANCDARPG